MNLDEFLTEGEAALSTGEAAGFLEKWIPIVTEEFESLSKLRMQVSMLESKILELEGDD